MARMQASTFRITSIPSSPCRRSTVSGPTRAKMICAATGIAPATKIKDLSDSEMDKIREQVGKFSVEGDLRREVTMSIKRLMDLGCYRGLAPPQGPPGPRPAHSHQCPDPQGAEEGPAPSRSPRA